MQRANPFGIFTPPSKSIGHGLRVYAASNKRATETIEFIERERRRRSGLKNLQNDLAEVFVCIHASEGVCSFFQRIYFVDRRGDFSTDNGVP